MVEMPFIESRVKCILPRSIRCPFSTTVTITWLEIFIMIHQIRFVFLLPFISNLKKILSVVLFLGKTFTVNCFTGTWCPSILRVQPTFHWHATCVKGICFVTSWNLILIKMINRIVLFPGALFPWVIYNCPKIVSFLLSG